MSWLSSNWKGLNWVLHCWCRRDQILSSNDNHTWHLLNIPRYMSLINLKKKKTGMDLAFGLPNEKKHEHIYLTTWNLNFSLHSRDTGKSTPNIIFKLFKFQRKLLCYYFLWNFQTEAIIPLEVEDLDLPVLWTCNGIYQNKIVYEIPNICVITIMI